MRAEMQRCAREGTPRPESSAVRAHVPGARRQGVLPGRRALARLGLERPELAPGESARIEELAGLDEIRDGLAEHLAQLAPGQRLALELRVVHELSYADVADRLGITEQAARARVSRGLRALGSALDPVAAAEG